MVELVMNSIYAIILFILIYRNRNKKKNGKSTFPEYRSISVMTILNVLPGGFFLIMISTCLLMGKSVCKLHMINAIFTTILLIMIYFPILYFFLNRLRAHLCTETIVLLWMLPNLICYKKIADSSDFNPSFGICISKQLATILLGIWGTGFLIVFGYYVIEHFRFKHQVVKNSQEIHSTELEEVIDQLQSELNCDQLRSYLKIYYDPELKTPLSFTNRIILPTLEYSKEDLYLILKHEINHISRDDPSFKMYIAFLKAFCWFNPFVCKCLRKSTDDMELNCDEAVLNGCDDVTRKRYASLILSTAGDERGFTTCLSVRGDSLRYRLSNIMHQTPKKAGYPLIFFVIFTLLCNSYFISIGIGGRKLNDTLWNEVEHVEYTLDYNDHDYDYKVKTLNDYLNSFELYRIEETDYDINEKDHIMFNGYRDDYSYYIEIYDHVIEINRSRNYDHFFDLDTYRSFRTEYYYAEDEIDIQYIKNLLYGFEY